MAVVDKLMVGASYTWEQLCNTMEIPVVKTGNARVVTVTEVHRHVELLETGGKRDRRYTVVKIFDTPQPKLERDTKWVGAFEELIVDYLLQHGETCPKYRKAYLTDKTLFLLLGVCNENFFSQYRNVLVQNLFPEVFSGGENLNTWVEEGAASARVDTFSGLDSTFYSAVRAKVREVRRSLTNRNVVSWEKVYLVTRANGSQEPATEAERVRITHAKFLALQELSIAEEPHVYILGKQAQFWRLTAEHLARLDAELIAEGLLPAADRIAFFEKVNMMLFIDGVLRRAKEQSRVKLRRKLNLNMQGHLEKLLEVALEIDQEYMRIAQIPTTPAIFLEFSTKLEKRINGKAEELARKWIKCCVEIPEAATERKNF